jgi:hypothetical protein
MKLGLSTQSNHPIFHEGDTLWQYVVETLKFENVKLVKLVSNKAPVKKKIKIIISIAIELGELKHLLLC